MKPRLLPSPSTTLRTSLFLIAVLLGACAAASTSTNSPAAATQPPIQLGITRAAPTLETATQHPLDTPTETSVPTLLPVATSRGPNLEATDPTTVSLASGQVQFVEFFRFT
jgi:hypothetical protein